MDPLLDALVKEQGNNLVMHATTSADNGAVRVLIMGMDMPTEHALLQRLQALPPVVPADADAGIVASSMAARSIAPLASSDDPWTCDLLIVAGSSAMSRVGQRIAQTRPSLPFWILDDDGHLRDGRGTSEAVLAPEALHAVLARSTDASQQVDAGAGTEEDASVTAAHAAANVDAGTSGTVATATGTPATPLTNVAVAMHDDPATAAPAVVIDETPGPAAAIATATTAPAAAIAPVVDTTPIAGLLRERVANGEGLATLTHDGQALLLLDFDRRLAAPAAGVDKDIASVLAADFHRLRLEPLSARDFNTSAASAQSMPLAPLLWNIALRIDGPVPLLDPMDRRTVLSLRQWPDFRALAHRHDHFRLCCLLLKRPSTTAEAADLLELDAATVDGFFNAAYLSGYAQVSRPAVVAPPAAESATPARKRGGSALARMWRSVRQGMQAGS